MLDEERKAVSDSQHACHTQTQQQQRLGMIILAKLGMQTCHLTSA